MDVRPRRRRWPETTRGMMHPAQVDRQVERMECDRNILRVKAQQRKIPGGMGGIADVLRGMYTRLPRMEPKTASDACQ